MISIWVRPHRLRRLPVRIRQTLYLRIPYRDQPYFSIKRKKNSINPPRADHRYNDDNLQNILGFTSSPGGFIGDRFENRAESGGSKKE
ncbi:MAG: hypothetical protein H7144_07830 [Burkholderiales bacterium]|nr:hypothetical protein [Phycisphaerae bacterium]